MHEVWKERKRSYRRWKTTGADNDMISWKLARAVATRTFKLAKQDEFRKCVSGMRVSTPAQQIYKKLRKIRGREIRKISILQQHGRLYTSTQEIVECLAEVFHQVLNASNYSSQFLVRKHKEERREICFRSNNSKAYNREFSMSELNFALQHASNTQPGPDQVYYNMLKPLPEVAQQHLLDIFNKIWIETFIPQKWKDATIMPKPNTDHSDPTNSRSLALTSCVCKLLEKLINNRLQQYLENNRLLTNVQCSFRKSRSTVDHLIRLDDRVYSGGDV